MTRDSRAASRMPFFEVELPGPRLLRQEPALQPIGEARDDALQVRQLLVQQMPQAAEFVGVAQRLGVDNLVGGRAERAVDRGVVGPAARHHPGPPRASGIIVAGARHHLAVGVGIAVFLGIAVGAVGGRAVGRGFGAGAGAFALALVVAFGVFALALVVVGG